MKTNSSPKVNNNPQMFAFMPEMVLEHLRHAKPKEYTIEVPEVDVQKIIISADPEIPELDAYFEAYPPLNINNKIY